MLHQEKQQIADHLIFIHLKQQKLTNLYQTQLFHEEPYILLAFQRLSRILTSISPFSTTISNTFIKNPTYWWHLRIFHAKPP
jgi:hypothetical protein